MTYSEQLTALIDKYIIEDGMKYEEAYAKAWAIVRAKEEAENAARWSDFVSRYVII